MLVQRAHRGEVSLREAQELVDETVALALWKPTGTRQLIPLTITTLADLLDGNLGEAGVLGMGFTNALYASVNDDSDFDPPGVSVVGSCP